MAVSVIDNGYKLDQADGTILFKPFGSWIVRNLNEIEGGLDELQVSGSAPWQIDLQNLERIDVAGAWLIYRTSKLAEGAGVAVEFVNVGKGARILLDEVRESDRDPILPKPERMTPVTVVEGTGNAILGVFRDMYELTTLIGAVMTVFANTLLRPSSIRFTSTIYHFEQTCLKAVPIIILITFVIGLIVAQQAIYQLKFFGAEEMAVNFVGIIILRELGVLLTAIMVAGRSGSAITAEIGAMRMREELDAVNTLALDPIEVIVTPRLVALIIAVPILTFIGDISALSAAAVVSFFYGGVPYDIFLSRLQTEVDFVNFTRGMAKAPFMAFMIGIVAIMEGLRVQGSTDSLGRHTTASVVKAIFLVIVIDGMFVVYYATVDG